MPDNFAITAGSGTTIGSDDVASVQYQRVKPQIGADGSVTDAVPAVAALDSTGTGIQAVGMVAQLDDTATSAVTENQFAHPRISTRRALLVEGVASGTNVNVLLAAGTNNIGDVDVLTLPASTNTIEVVGDVAHDAVNAGNPVAVGGTARVSQPAAVADGDRAEFYTDRHGRHHTRSGHQTNSASIWTQLHLPAANTQATKTNAAAGVGVRNVCTSITAVVVATATAPTAIQLNVSLIDGATGGTTFLWRAVLSLPATAGETRGIALSNLWIPGTANTAMTLEFSAAGGANTVESVSMTGLTITE